MYDRVLRELDDAPLLAALRACYAPGALPDEAALAAELRGRIVDVPVPGGALRVDLGDWTARLIVRLGGWEPHLARLARRIVRPGDLAVDAGAHVGAWTLLLRSLVGDAGRVVAYEPLPRSAERARQATAGRAEIVEAALGAAPGRRPLYAYRGPRYAGADSMLCSLVAGDGYSPVAEVQVTTLDAADLPRVDVLKIDTEGAELEVLRGARATLGRSPEPRLLVELHPVELAAAGQAVTDVTAELAAAGLAVFDLVPDGATLAARLLPPGQAPTAAHVLARRDPTPFAVSLLGVG